MKKINLKDFFLEDLEVEFEEKKIIVKRHNLVVNCVKFYNAHGLETFKENFMQIFKDNCSGDLEIIDLYSDEVWSTIYIDATEEYTAKEKNMGLSLSQALTQQKKI